MLLPACAAQRRVTAAKERARAGAVAAGATAARPRAAAAAAASGYAAADSVRGALGHLVRPALQAVLYAPLRPGRYDTV